MRNISLAAGLVFLTACAAGHPNKPDRVADSYEDLLSQATEHVLTVCEKVGLPGIGKGPMKNLEVHGDPGPVPKRVHYPVTFKVYLTAESDPPEYRYLVTRASKHTQWQIVAAWKYA